MDYIKVILTSVLSAVALFLIAKIMGHKQMSQLDFFDYITGITIGSIAAELATELEKPLNPLIAMLVYGAITVLLTLTTSKLPRMRKFINGTPTIIMASGKIYRENMKKAKMDLSEFLVMCRQEGYFNLGDIQTAVFEYNGRLSILPKATKRPANPTDLNIVPTAEHIFTEIIMDGQILNDNLNRMDLSLERLQNTLKVNGYKSAKDVFLCLYDQNGEVLIYGMN